MEQSIVSVIILKYAIISKSEKEALRIVGTFTCDRICKGQRPDEFHSRPGTEPRETVCYQVKNDLIIAYQRIDLDTVVDEKLTNKNFLELFDAYIKANHRLRYDDQNFDNIAEILILDHIITRRDNQY